MRRRLGSRIDKCSHKLVDTVKSWNTVEVEVALGVGRGEATEAIVGVAKGLVLGDTERGFNLCYL